MNDCKACGGFFSCGGNTAECLHPEGAAAVAAAQSQSPSQLPASKEVAGGFPNTFAASVRVPAEAKPAFDALTRQCLNTGTDVGALMGNMLAVAVQAYLGIKVAQ